MSRPGMQSETLDNIIAAVEQQIRDLEADIKKAESKAEEAQAEGDAEDLRFWRTKEQQLRAKEQQLRDEKARKEVLQQGSSQPTAIKLPSGHGAVRFWSALKESSINEDPNGYTFLSLDDAFFLGGFRQSSIMMRRCYTDLWDLLMKGEERKLIVTGTPGIGKTLWQFFVMRKLAKMGATVVVDFEGYPDCLCFSGSTVREGPLRAFKEELNQRATWYLVDAKKPILFDAMTILTTSPMREIYKNFAKAGALKLLMPVWSEDELLAAGRSLYGLSEDRVRELYALWGGSARYVLQYANNPASQKDLDMALANASIDQIYKAMGIRPDSAPEVSHRLLHINVKDDYISQEMIFASAYIAHQVGEGLCAGSTVPLESLLVFLAGRPMYSDVRGKLFEVIAHRKVASGGSFTSWNLETGKEEPWELSASCSMQTYYALENVREGDDGVYWMPSHSNAAAIDSLRQPNMLFQMTVANMHTINGQGLFNAAQQLALPNPELIFVVPEDVYPRWRSKQQYSGRTDFKVLQRTKQRVIKLPLHARSSSLSLVVRGMY